MSFLLEVEPQVEPFLVTEILALLDVDDECFDSVLKKPQRADREPTTCRARKPHCKNPKQDSPKPRRGRQATSSHPRIRNKGKIEHLRREIEDLQAELAELQRTEQEAADKLTSQESRRAESLWKVIAMKQNQERERAEERNQALKRLLTAQYSLTASLSGVLSEWTRLPAPESASVCI